MGAQSYHTFEMIVSNKGPTRYSLVQNDYLEDGVSKRKSQVDKTPVVVLEAESIVTCSNVSSKGQFYEVLSAGMVCSTYDTGNPCSNSFQHMSKCYL